MSLSSMKNAVTRGVGKQILSAKKHSPHIFFAAGVVGTVGAAVMACRATLKLNETLDDIQKEKDIVEERNDPATQQREMALVYGRGSLKLAKLYGPSMVVGSLSIAALTGSHIQLTRRNTALMAAYTALQTAYESYRERVREVLGEEKERDLYFGAQTEKVIDGKTSEDVKVIDPNKTTTYGKWFDEGCEDWQRDAEMNLLFLKCKQEWLNHRLQARGYLFLNEVYAELGIDPTKQGQVVGWLIGGKNSDNYVDFGLYHAHNAQFVNGREPSIFVDFNVDGVIYNDFTPEET